MTNAFRVSLIWIACSAVAIFFQLMAMDAAIVDNAYVPMGNDSFYHARRILDTAANPAGFYEFDDRIHTPEGSVVVWPWGYDYLVAQVVRASTALGLASSPMSALVHVPVVAVIATVGLVVLIARLAGLGTFYTLLAGLMVAVLPLTASLHGLGSLDHHFAEYLFVLATLAAGMIWLRRPKDVSRAALAGFLLGVAPAFHTALFVLQLPLLAALAILWLRGVAAPRRSVLGFSVAILLSTALILVPSLPVRLGYFDFGYLSWFQLYVAVGTCIVLGYFSAVSFSARALLYLVLGGLLLLAPLLRQFVLAGSFLGKDIVLLSDISEAKNLLRVGEEHGWIYAIGIFSPLIVMLPLVTLGSAWGVFTSRAGDRLLFWVYGLAGTISMYSQFRFHYFGSAAMILVPLVGAQWLGERIPAKVATRWLAALVFGGAIVYSGLFLLFSRKPPANDPYYQLTRFAMPALAEQCKADPGVVLAVNNDGHYIRYHTECSVIANNFLLTDLHQQKVREMEMLMRLTPDQLLQAGRPIKYVLARALGALALTDSGDYVLAPKELALSVNSTLFHSLLWDDVKTINPRYKLIEEHRMPGPEGYVYSRLWKIEPPVTGGPATGPAAPAR